MSDQSLPAIPGYTLTAQLYAGRHIVVYRAVDEYDGQSVVIKVLRSHTPSIHELVRFRNQYIIAKNLVSPVIVKPLALVPWHRGYALVMEDIGGISLRQYLQTHDRLAVEQVLAIALQLADSLHHLSQHRILHKDINPANILIHPDTHQIWLTDFSLASLLPKESQELQSPRSLEGTLAYIAPEQTGRMNRGIDYRADFYSLGVTLYELLTGELPFKSHDPMELIHSHIAKAPSFEGGSRKSDIRSQESGVGSRESGTSKPISNSKFRRVSPFPQGIPDSLSRIILKLMAKNAEDRYQSALGLKYDLRQCLDQWTETGTVTEFELGQRDVCDRFLIPEKLYGREVEVDMLMTAFKRVAQGASELMLVAGYSGVGKTAVVNEVHKPITRQKGYFIKGKFDQLNRNIPFSGFVQALRRLMEQLLSESNVALADWQTKILAAIGQQGQVLIDVIPELALIIGPQPKVQELSGQAAQNRFKFLFEKFITVFATPAHPLVIFLDDLQWVDSASLNLMKVLMGDSQTGYLLLLGAYRDNEVFPVHPLMLTLDDLDKQNTTRATITLEPLATSQINQLVAATLSCPVELATPLTEIVYQKTAGNPFFTIQFLKGLHEDRLITFDHTLGYWECDLVEVREAALTDDVVKFMVERLHRLPDETQNVLKLSACIGNQFDLETLAIICNAPSVDVANDLWSTLQSGLILPQSDAYKFFQGREAQDQNQRLEVSYHFLHDRVQQAAYALIAKNHKQITHLTIGRLLLQKFSLENREKNLFKIVNQLNMGSALIELPRELEELAKLNLTAAQKAKSAAAYGAAANYLVTAIELLHTEPLSTEPWHTHYELMLPLYNLLAEVSYLNGEYDASQQQTQIVIANAQSLIDQVKAYEIRISLSIAQGQCQRALDVGLEILNLLDVSLDDAPLPDIDIDRLYQLPTITNSKIIAALSILSKLWAPALIAGSELLPQVILTMLNLSATHGNSAIAAFAYSLYGMLLCAKMTDIKLGYRFGQLALHTLERYEDAELTCKVNQLFHAFIRNWKELARDRIECLADNVLTGLETGDIEFACYASINYCDNLFLIGDPLNIIHKKQTYYIELAKSLQQPMQHATLCSWGQMVDNLMGMADEPTQLVGNRFYEFEQIPKLQESGVGSTLFFIYTSKTILDYLFNDYEQTLSDSQAAIAYEQAGEGMLPITQISLYRSLGLLALYPTFDLDRQTQSLDEVEIHQQRLKIWATHAPMNHQHKVDLVEAEKCRVLGQKLEALELYDKAIAGAKENKYLQEEALANELAARFYLDWDKEEIAALYLQKAYYCYNRWGAKAKTDDLANHYADLLQPILKQTNTIDPLETLHSITPVRLSVHSSIISSQADTSNLNSTLDLATIFKSAQALSESIDLSDLFEKMASMMLQTSGAERLVLLLPDTDRAWQVRVLATTESTQLASVPLIDNSHLPVQLIRYVQRTQEILVVDGLGQPLPIIDPYLQQYSHYSVLCLPLLHQTKLLGLLYLEHCSVTGVFSRDRITILNFLCSQAAISLENAQLNQVLQQKLEVQTAKREASEIRFHNMVNNVPGVVYQGHFTENGEFIFHYASSDCHTLYEVSAEAVMSGEYSFRDFEHSEDRSTIDQKLTEAMRALQPFDHEFRIITPSGTLKWVHMIGRTSSPMPDGCILWDGIVLDVSDRKATELALQDSQFQLHRLMENIPGVAFCYVLHPDGSNEFTYVSSYIRELYEMEPEEVLRQERSPWDVVHPDDVNYLVSKIQESAQTLQPIIVEHRLILPNKGLRWGQHIGRPERQKNGDIVWHGVSFDVTDRKTTELALQDAQVQFRRMTENVPGMIFRYVLHSDGSDELTYVSSQVQELFEIDTKTALQNTTQMWGRVHPDDVPRISHDIQVSAETLQPFTSSYRLVLPEKGLRCVQNMTTVERLNNGDVVWDGIVVDISDLKHYEQRLKELSERLELAIDSAQIGIWEWNYQDNYLSWNKQMFEIYGISSATFEGTHQDWEKCVHPDDLKQAQPQENDKYPHAKEFRIIRPDGSIRYVASTVIRKYDDQGQPIWAVGTNIDISDRKQAELSLQQEVLRRATIFNTSSDGIHIVNKEGNLIEANASFCRMLGYTSEELAHLNVADWDAQWSREELRELLQRYPQHTSEIWRFETLHRRKAGSIFPVEISVCSMKWNGQLSLICIARDISERKQAEIKLQRTNKELIRATRLKDEFLANMSHELRTPLNSILGLSEALQDTVFGPLTQQQLKYLKTIEQSGTHLLELINDILDVAKIESGQVELDLKATNIGHLCESSMAFVKQQALKKRISLKTTFPPQPLHLLIDERRILQSLVNLLNNAVKFTPEGGCVALEVSCHQQNENGETLDLQETYEKVQDRSKLLLWESGVLMSRGYIKISVTDTGIGITPEHINKLFKPFSQIDSALNRKYMGTGLGLVLVKQMTELHGGTVSVTSKVGVGSCFSINLPYNPDSPPVEISPSSDDINQTAPSVSVEPEDAALILLAEDNEDTINVMVSYLKYCGYRLLTAKNGLEAIQLAQTHRPDLILMDIQMPEVSGLEAIKRIRQDSQLKAIPIIALTALAMAGDQERCLDAGANLYLSKPVKLKQLGLSIQRLLDL